MTEEKKTIELQMNGKNIYKQEEKYEKMRTLKSTQKYSNATKQM